ncbi:MAG: cytochrome C assembly protein [Oleiphilus sp.]|nr:MAG: cytochrome C assembly protein [Oleiphilus sp.]
MNIMVLSLMSAGLYALGTTYQLLAYLKKLELKPFISLLIGTLAALSQLALTGDQLYQSNSYNFNLFTTASLITGLIALTMVILATRKPVQSTLLLIYPLAAISVLASTQWNTPAQGFEPQESGIFFHISLSVIAYCILSIAAIQAIFIYAQNNNLKKKNNTILMRNLPPLLTMEKLLFEMLWSGTAILALAVFAGFIFVDHLFAQHLAHKTFFSLLSLAVLSTLLYGRYKHGWRGLMAIKLTLWGTGFLMLGFFGSKFVLEWVLTKP